MTSWYRAAALCVLAALALTACSKPPAEPASPPAPAPAMTAPAPARAPAPAPAPVAQPAPPLPKEKEAKLEAPAPPPKPAKPPEPKAKEKPAAPAKPVAAKPKEQPKEKARGLVIEAEVVTVSKVPDPSSVPYKDCLTMIKYKVVRVESGTYDGAELLAAHRGMRDGKLTAAAHLQVGERLTLTLDPLDKHPEASRMMSADDTGEYSLTPYLVTASH